MAAATDYGAVEAPEGPIAAQKKVAPSKPNRAAKIVCGLVVAGVVGVATNKALSPTTPSTASPVLAAQTAEVEAATEELVIGSWQREALRGSLNAVGESDQIIFGHENSNREGQWFWDNAGMDSHSDVFNTTGQYPGMYGFSFQDIIDGSKLTNHVLNAAKQNAVIEFFWEANNPVNDGSARDATGYPCKALQPGGSANDKWVEWMDVVVTSLKEFKIGETHIPIILRLFHECTESWYWWGEAHCDAENYKAAWNYTRWYITDHSGVENVLFVYAPAKVSETTWQAYTNWYPGTDQVDIIGFDRYAMSGTYKDYARQDCEIACDFAAAEGKPCALAETGIADGIQNIANDEWFMTDVLDNLLNTSTPDSSCNNLAYMLTWSNEQPWRYWVPLPSQTTAQGFIDFCEDTRTVFAGDVRWSDVTKENGYGFKNPGKSADIHGSDDGDPRPIDYQEPVNGVNGKLSTTDAVEKDWGPFIYTEERLAALPAVEQEKILRRR